MIEDLKYLRIEVAAVKAVWEGKGDPSQQRLVLQMTIEKLGSIYSTSFNPENTHMTAFNEGRRWVARQLQDLITMPDDKLIEEKKNEPRSDSKSVRKRATSRSSSRKRSSAAA